jgi:hypothetical protein
MAIRAPMMKEPEAATDVFHANGTTPLLIAREKRHRKIVQRLLQHPDINKNSFWAYPNSKHCVFLNFEHR